MMTDTDPSTQRLRQLNRMYRTISRCNHYMIRAEGEQMLAQDFCLVMVEEGSYRMVWVGYAENDEARSIRPIAYAGLESGYLENLDLTWADTDRGSGPGARCIREQTIQVTRDIANDPRFVHWREEATERGYASSIALPLKIGAGTLGFLGMYSDRTDAFDEEEIGLLTEAADDLAYGITALRNRHERDALKEGHLAQIEAQNRLLNATVQALATMVEVRDPYTAGHQRRVATLAVAIATEMRLPAERIEGLRLAAEIHDIGKIKIPAEILVSPRKLSAAEFEIVKTHSTVGYDILKDIRFPTPVAQIVLQHHEKLDGSGYPAGLKQEQILLEARILCVADVVEAMASHRPYRPGLGVPKALQEISEHKGLLYDSDVVSVCVSLFESKQFEL
jgi:putative nucleotidyltransferase with HDIG domain